MNTVYPMNISNVYMLVIANIANVVDKVITELVMEDELRNSIKSSIDDSVVTDYYESKRLSDETDECLARDTAKDYMYPDYQD